MQINAPTITTFINYFQRKLQKHCMNRYTLILVTDKVNPRLTSQGPPTATATLLPRSPPPPNSPTHIATLTLRARGVAVEDDLERAALPRQNVVPVNGVGVTQQLVVEQHHVTGHDFCETQQSIT